MISLKELVTYCDSLLGAERYRDYCPNGLQVEGRSEVRRIVTGVSASQALIDAAVEDKTDLLLVHHGFFWKGEPAPVIGIKRRRLAALLKQDISLLAYHLPLDGHDQYGNNAQLARLFGFEVEGRFGGESGDGVGMFGRLPHAMTPEALGRQIELRLGRTPLHLSSGKHAMIERVAWCSGAAQNYIEAAQALDVQAFISGEVSEYTTHWVRETGIEYFAAGHHATERYGVHALGEHLAERFQLQHRFIDVDNPV